MPERNDGDLAGIAPMRLARMIESAVSLGGEWRPEELASILRHQLSAPVDFRDLAVEPGPAGSRRSGTSPRLAPGTFYDLLHGAKPSLRMLEQTKDFAKANRQRSDGLLPHEIATVLYYGSILVASLRHGISITRLDATQLGEGIGWVLRQSWVDADTKRLFQEGRRHLDPSGAGR